MGVKSSGRFVKTAKGGDDGLREGGRGGGEDSLRTWSSGGWRKRVETAPTIMFISSDTTGLCHTGRTTRVKRRRREVN